MFRKEGEHTYKGKEQPPADLMNFWKSEETLAASRVGDASVSAPASSSRQNPVTPPVMQPPPTLPSVGEASVSAPASASPKQLNRFPVQKRVLGEMESAVSTSSPAIAVSTLSPAPQEPETLIPRPQQPSDGLQLSEIQAKASTHSCTQDELETLIFNRHEQIMDHLISGEPKPQDLLDYIGINQDGTPAVDPVIAPVVDYDDYFARQPAKAKSSVNM